MKSKKHIAASIALALMLALQSMAPTFAASMQDGPKQGRAAQRDDDATIKAVTRIPRLDPAKQLEIETFAQIVADTLVYNDDGTVSVNSKKAASLTRTQRRQLNNAVQDINSGQIGLAMTGEDGLKVYGNTQVLNELNPSTPLSGPISGKGRYWKYQVAAAANLWFKSHSWTRFVRWRITCHLALRASNTLQTFLAYNLSSRFPIIWQIRHILAYMLSISDSPNFT